MSTLSAKISGDAIILWLLAAFVLHEAGHLLALRMLGLRGRLGGGLGVAVKVPPAVQGWRAALVAVAGPCANLLAMWLALRVGWQTAAQLNFVLAAVNSLPVLPLDGGRVLLGLGSGVVAWRKLAAALLLMGRALALALVMCVYYFGLSRWLLVAALWLYLLAMQHDKQLVYLHTAALAACSGMRRRPLRFVRQKHNLPLYRLVRRLSPGWRNVVLYRGRVLSGDKLLAVWQQGGGGLYLSDIIKKYAVEQPVKKENKDYLPNNLKLK